MSGSGGPKQPGDKDRRSRRWGVAGAAAMLFGGSKAKPSKDTAGAATTRSTVTESPQEIVTRLEADIQKRINKQLSIEAFMRSRADLKLKFVEVLDLKRELELIQQQVDQGARSNLSQEDRDKIKVQLEQQIALLRKGGDPVLDFWIRYGQDVIELNAEYLDVQQDMLPGKKAATPSWIVVYLRRLLFEHEQSTDLYRDGQDILQAYKKLFDDVSAGTDRSRVQEPKRWAAAVAELQAGIEKLKEKESRLDDMDSRSESGPHSPDLR